MAVQEQQNFISAAEFWTISHSPEYADKVVELIEGELVIMSRPGWEHGYITGEMYHFIRQHARQHNLGYATVESGYIIEKKPKGKDTVLGPDVAFVAANRMPDPLPDGYMPIVPDLVVEVVSPNDLAFEIEDKVALYLKAGVRLIWVMNPRSKTITIHRPGSVAILDQHGTLDGEDVLPGFTLKVAEVFPKK